MDLNDFRPDTCPVGCVDKLPLPKQSSCVDTETGLIDTIYIANPDFPFEDVSDAAEWAERLSTASMATALANAIRALAVFDGTKPKVTPNQSTSNRGFVKNKKTARTLTFEEHDGSLDVRDFYQLLECLGPKRIWYKVGGKLFGGNSGILGQFTSAEGIEDGDGPTQTRTVTFTWSSAYEEPATLAVV